MGDTNACVCTNGNYPIERQMLVADDWMNMESPSEYQWPLMGTDTSEQRSGEEDKCSCVDLTWENEVVHIW